MKNISWIALLVSLAVPLVAGGLGSLAGGDFGAYQALKQPFFAPPSAVFPIAWSILYLMMGTSCYLIYQSGHAELKTALIIYAVQLFFNAMWSFFFFGLKMRLFAFVWLAVLFALVVVTVILFFRISKSAGFLMLPYTAWLVFAGTLNWSVYRLNR